MKQFYYVLEKLINDGIIELSEVDYVVENYCYVAGKELTDKEMYDELTNKIFEDKHV